MAVVHILRMSCSSSQSSAAENVCNIFYKVPSDRWTPSSASYFGAYLGTTYSTSVNTGTQYGEWAQIQLPSAITLSSFILYPYTDLSRAPLSFVLAGSNNGSTWVLLSDQTGITSWASGAGLTYTVAPRRRIVIIA